MWVKYLNITTTYYKNLLQNTIIIPKYFINKGNIFNRYSNCIVKIYLFQNMFQFLNHSQNFTLSLDCGKCKDKRLYCFTGL